MEPEVKRLLDEFGDSISWHDGSINGFPTSWKGWFRLEISPLPPKTERELVATDIDNERTVLVTKNGRLRHYDDCEATTHYFVNVAKARHIKQGIKRIPETTFKVALFVGRPGILDGQPVAIVVDPPINYYEYTIHPHLNAGGYVGLDCYLPDSVCYTDNPQHLGQLGVGNRLLAAVDQVSIWLYRHLIWVETEEWIGPHKPASRIEVLNIPSIDPKRHHLLMGRVQLKAIELLKKSLFVA